MTAKTHFLKEREEDICKLYRLGKNTAKKGASLFFHHLTDNTGVSLNKTLINSCTFGICKMLLRVLSHPHERKCLSTSRRACGCCCCCSG